MSIETSVSDFCLYFPRSANQSHIVTTASNGASVIWDNTVLNLSTGPNPYSSACTEGYLPCYLNQEPKVKVTLNAAFAPPQDGLQQLIGLGDSERGVFVGFDGLKFGILNRRGGRRKHWVFKALTECLTSGNILITLNDKVHSISVVAGMTPMQIMYTVFLNSPTIAADNIRIYACFDRLTLYTDGSDDFVTVAPDSVDFQGTGITGSLSVLIQGVAVTNTWLYREQFNAVTRYAAEDLVLTDMNVYEFLFSRWSTGSIHFSMLNTHNDDMTELHVWSPGPQGFKTSLPYMPTIFIMNAPSVNSNTGNIASSVSTMKSSMASISSGTPSTNTNNTSFATTFVASNIEVVSSENVVIGMLTVPRATSSGRNYMLASINRMVVNVDTPRSIRVKVIVNGAIDTLNATVAHLPWSCVRRATPVATTLVSGGLSVASMYIRETSGERSFDPSQLWLAPGTNLVIAVCAVDDPVTCSLDVDVFWSEV